MGTKKMQLELRPADNGEFDELVAKNVEMVHLETLTDQSLYIGIYGGAGEQMIQVWVNADKPLRIEQSSDGVEVMGQPVSAMHVRMPTESEIIGALTTDQLVRLREHAMCLACKDGNAFDGLIDQYLPDAYENLWRNSRVGERDGLPMIYPASAGDHWYAFITPEHPSHSDMDDARRAELVAAFTLWNGSAN